MLSFQFVGAMNLLLILLISVSTCISEDNIKPTETQKAHCTVTAGDVKASAEATMTKALDGVCGSEELHKGLQNLEQKLLNEIKSLKDALKKLLKNNENVIRDHSINKEMLKDNPKSNKSKLLLNNVREREIEKMNNTMSYGGELKLFSYYWQLQKASYILKSNSFELSPIFTILGKHMRIKAIFQHLGRDFLFLKLEQVPKGFSGNKKFIVLDTGDLFKEIGDKISLKYRIAILDQVNPAGDLISNELTSTDTGFLVPNSAILSNTYSKGDKILIKLLIHL